MNTQSWGWQHFLPPILKPFSFQVVFSGFFYGLLALFLLIPALGGDYLWGFPIAFASGLAYGALMGGLSALARQVMPGAGWLAGLGLLLAGALAGGLIWFALQALPLSGWIPLPPPPEQALRFAGGGVFIAFNGELWVAAESEQLYAYHCDLGDGCAWRPVAPGETAPEATQGCTEGEEPDFIPPPVFGRVVDQTTARYCGVNEHAVFFQYALRANGDVLSWSGSTWGFERLVLLPLSVVAGALIGPVGLLILHRNWREKDPEYMKGDNG